MGKYNQALQEIRSKYNTKTEDFGVTTQLKNLSSDLIKAVKSHTTAFEEAEKLNEEVRRFITSLPNDTEKDLAWADVRKYHISSDIQDRLVAYIKALEAVTALSKIIL